MNDWRKAETYALGQEPFLMETGGGQSRGNKPVGEPQTSWLKQQLKAPALKAKQCFNLGYFMTRNHLL